MIGARVHRIGRWQDVFVAGSIAIAIACAAGAACPVAAGEPWMAPDDLRATFGGQRIAGIYPDGDAFEEVYHAGGAVSYWDDPKDLRSGKWSVVGSAFCTLYDPPGGGACFAVRRESGNCFLFYFAAGTEAEAAAKPEPDPNWSARAWLTDRPSTCKDGQLV